MASDFELLDAWAAGDRAAGGELFRRHFDARLARAKDALRKRVRELQASPADVASMLADLEQWAASLRDAMADKT